MPQLFSHHNQLNAEVLVNRLLANDPGLYDVNCHQWSLDALSSKAIFKALENNTHVEILRFFGNQSSGAIQQLAASIETHPSLRQIYLDNNGLTDNDFLHLADALRKNRSSVELLDISSNNITSLSASYIIELIEKTRIEKLDISFNRINDDGLKYILDALEDNPETSLQELCDPDALNEGFLTQNRELIQGFQRFFSGRQNSMGYSLS